MAETRKADTKVIVALALVHFTGDFYASFINPLMPLFVEKLSLTLTQIGLIAGISRFFAFIIQPSAGYIADHYRTRLFVLGGPFLAAMFIPLVGVAPSFILLLLFISVGSIGTAMFHPTSAGMVSTYAGSHLGFSMSIFNMGGTLAFGVGPLFIAYFVHTFGLEASPWTMILGLFLILFLYKIVPLPSGEDLGRLGFISSIREALGKVWKAIALIWVIMVLRSFVSQSFLTFLPVYYAREGHSLVSIGIIIALFTVAGALSGLIAGHLSDRLGYKPVFFEAHGLATPSAPGKIHGIQLDDGSRIRRRRDDDALDRHSSGSLLHPPGPFLSRCRALAHNRACGPSARKAALGSRPRSNLKKFSLAQGPGGGGGDIQRP